MRAAALFRAERDLPGFALRLFPGLLASILLAKGLAISEAYRGEPAAQQLQAFAGSLPHDFLFLGIVAAAILLSQRLRLPDRYRRLVLLALSASFALGVLLTFVNVGFFIYLGAPLTTDLLLLAPSMFGYMLHSLTWQAAAIFALALFLTLAGLSLAIHRGQAGRASPRWSAAAFSAGLLLAGTALQALPASGYREAALRSLSGMTLLLPSRPHVDVHPPPLDEQQRRTLADLLGPPRDEGALAFAGLARRKRNLLLFVWESVGERHLRAHSPLGSVRTPELERIEARGSVRFTRATTECPLSVQSMWALLTGTSPPGSPMLFLSQLPLPPRRTLLAERLREAGFRTALFNGSYSKAWHEERITGLGGFDAVEDVDTLANRARFRTAHWSIEARAINARFFDWLDEAPAAPFFAVLWPVETHHPYFWHDMPKELERASMAERYLAGVEHSDRILGELYAELERRHLLADTLLVVIGDHGEGIGRAPHPHDQAHSRLVYEDDLLVPLVFANPELPPAQAVELQASHVDVYPTALDLMGFPVPPGLDGVSLAATLRPRPHYARSVTWWPLAVRAGRYKLTQHSPDAMGELFDTEADPFESRDLARAEPAIAGTLRAALQQMSAARHRDDPSFAALERFNFTAFWTPLDHGAATQRP